ncbi:hypothetical protein P691DRAFT_613060, partial [Macrolepiota fuliginosa MF-IS2]
VQQLLFDYNSQHDCYKGKCSTSGSEPVQQEHIDSGLTQGVVVHSDLDQFVINTHAFHNAHLICEVVPQESLIGLL